MVAAEFNISHAEGHISIETDKAPFATTSSRVASPVDRAAIELPQVENPRMQVVFDKTVCDALKLSYQYQEVNVLIIRWAEHLDRDLKCGAEVEELQELFRDQFHFPTEVLELDDARSPQLQLDTGVNNFILKNDGPCRTHLLVVYYTGHGAGAADGLWFVGERDRAAAVGASKLAAEAHWNTSERSLLHHAQADVLTILDTCCAGNVMNMKGVAEDMRSFEILVATTEMSPTSGPGPRSFSRALIDSLKDQLAADTHLPFTAFDLNGDIIQRRKVQKSHVFTKLNRQSHRHIKLAPLVKRSTREPEAPSNEASYVTVRFTFEHIPSLLEHETVTLAKSLSKAAMETNLGINRIELLEAVGTPRLAEATRLLTGVKKAQRQWRKHVESRKRKREEGLDAEAVTEKRSRQPLTPISTTRSPHESPV